MKKIIIRINTPLLKYKAGTIIEILSDENNIPLDSYWFRRLKDSRFDNCIEVVKASKKQKPNNNNKKEVISHERIKS